jgi:hypothetical protein
VPDWKWQKSRNSKRIKADTRTTRHTREVKVLQSCHHSTINFHLLSASYMTNHGRPNWRILGQRYLSYQRSGTGSEEFDFRPKTAGILEGEINCGAAWRSVTLFSNQIPEVNVVVISGGDQDDRGSETESGHVTQRGPRCESLDRTRF